MGVLLVVWVVCLMKSRGEFVFILSWLVSVLLVSVELICNLVCLRDRLQLFLRIMKMFCVVRFFLVSCWLMVVGRQVRFSEIGLWFRKCRCCSFVILLCLGNCSFLVICGEGVIVLIVSMWVKVLQFMGCIVLLNFCSCLRFWNVLGLEMKLFLLWMWKIRFLFCRLLSVCFMVIWLMLNVVIILFFDGIC